MISREIYEEAVKRTLMFFEKAGIVLTDEEKENVEVADFGLNDLEHTGLELITYLNTERVCAKELVLFPHQRCPEHRHPAFGSYIGKEETFRCRWGEVYLYVDGKPTENIKAIDKAGVYTVFHEIVLRPGEQYTLSPNTKHWFEAGSEGAVVSEFSTPSYDEKDIFTDPRIERTPQVGSNQD
ncbi:MAG: D-lyxose/D-mannose family sugar isomerase [Sphaerochaeta sp.]|nr:D-lyxose/D-mannose family sugar isomerase [Sphaerochaeta sp.]